VVGSGKRVLGLDIGIGSCGWAVIETAPWEIVASGSRCFEVPELAKNKKLTNAVRRKARGQRKVIRRRRQRLEDVRGLLDKAGLPRPGRTDSGTVAGHVWQLRAEALERLLTPGELAAVLIHIAKHRGFKSNRKRDRDNQAESGKMLTVIQARERDLGARYPTFGAMMAQAPEFALRKRNSKDDYRHTPLRSEVEREARKILSAQRDLGNTYGGASFEEDFVGIAFRQRPLQDSVRLLGRCRLEPKQPRAARHCPSFERFRYLSKLATLRVSRGSEAPRPLTEVERDKALELAGKSREISYSQLRKAIGLAGDERFEGLSRRAKNPESASLGDFQATTLLAEVLGEVELADLMARTPQQLDDAMAAIVFHETPETIDAKLAGIGLDEAVRHCLIDNVGMFARLSGAGHISACACRRLLPLLEAGLGYPQSCERLGYKHWDMGGSRINSVKNPVVRKVLRECVRQIEVVIATFGKPDEIHLEMARAIGKSAKERDDIDTANEKRRAERRRNRDAFEKLLDTEPRDDELAAFELWQEQHHRCLYCDRAISCKALTAGDNSVQVDHILPFSRSGDNSFRNKVLTHTGCNQDKRDRTPFEWMADDAERWQAFMVRVDAHTGLHHQKKRNLKNKSFAARESAYRERHLNDSRYAMRVLRIELRARFGELGEGARFFAVPGAMTAMVRRAWGVDSLKKDNILGDRDHALDALVVASVDRSRLQQATAAYQKVEIEGRGRFVPPVRTPVDDAAAFRRALAEAALGVFVSRSETRRGRGALHADTLYGLKDTPDGTVQTERKPVSALKPADLDRLVGDPERCRCLRAALAAWLDAAARAGVKPDKHVLDHPPRMPTRDGSPGPVIRSVRLVRKALKSGLPLQRGEKIAHVDLETMVRADVFTKAGKYYLVPVYAHQVANRRDFSQPPNRAVVAHKAESEWAEVDATYEFLFSLYPGSWIEAIDRSGEVHEGYYRSLDRRTASISFSRHFEFDSKAQLRVGTKTLRSFRKFNVDRLGHRSVVGKERRVWHGAALS